MAEPLTDPSEHEQSRSLLLGLARGVFGLVPPGLIADHVLAHTEGADWALRRAALLALGRRQRFAERDELCVDGRPEGDALLGDYLTRSDCAASRGLARGARPYLTRLVALAPLATSCSCADFVRSSLGLCKHGLTVLGELAARDQLGQRSLEPRPAQLRWDPRHPLEGRADRLERLYGDGDNSALPAALRSRTSWAEALATPERRRALIAQLEECIERGQLTAEPAVSTLLREERERVAELLDDPEKRARAVQSLAALKRELYPYQRAGVERFFCSGRLLLADDMGLGKTTQAVAAAHALFAARSIHRGLLIVPNSLKPQWRREWEATTDLPITPVEGAPRERKRTYRAGGEGFLLIAYEQLVRDLDEVQRFAPELVVLDEAQRIKNWATKSAAYVKALSPRYRLVLTGTPLENRLDELASIMDFVDDLALEPKWRLAPLHTLQDGSGAAGLGGAKNLDTLRERLSTSMLRRVRREVLSQLPKRSDTRVPIELTKLQAEAHDELRQPIAKLAHAAAQRTLRPAEFMRLMQLLMRQRMICNGMAQLQFDEHWPRIEPLAPTPALLEGLFAPKLSAFRGLVEEVVLAQGRKAVVFSQWRNMLKLADWAVRDLMQAAGLRTVFFTGAESPRERERSVRGLNEEREVAIMFLSDAGGVGLNLQQAASACVNLELPWNPAVLEQRIGRIYRLGQSQPVDVYNLVTEEGIEARIAQIVAQKSALFHSLFDGTSDEVRFEGHGSFMASLHKLVDLPDLAEASGARSLVEDDDEAALLAVSSLADELPSQSSAEGARAARPESLVVASPTLQQRGLTVTRLADGGLRIDAPAALAEPLAELLEALDRSLHTRESQRAGEP